MELLFDEAGVYFHECEVIDCDSFKMVMEKANQIEMKGNNYPSIIEQLGINNKKETNRKEMLRDMKKSLVNMR